MSDLTPETPDEYLQRHGLFEFGPTPRLACWHPPTSYEVFIDENIGWPAVRCRECAVPAPQEGKHA